MPRKDDSMCYSARILPDCRRYVRLFGATASLGEFVDLFLRRAKTNPPALGASGKGYRIVEAVRAATVEDHRRHSVPTASWSGRRSTAIVKGCGTPSRASA